MTLFAQQTVQDFFENSNWQGLKTVETNNLGVNGNSSNRSPLLKPHFNLTVEEFFSRHNWQGVSAVKYVDDLDLVDGGVAPRSQSTGQVYSLTMSVEEFFQRMVWQGGVQTPTIIAPATPIAQTDKSTEKLKNIPDIPNPSAKKYINLQDLSDLM